MKGSNMPKWLNKSTLKEAASSDLKAKSLLTVNLPNDFKTISSYQCNTCRSGFTSGQVEPQLKKAARMGQGYIECPRCSGFLMEKNKVIVKNTAALTNKAERYVDKNVGPQRSINTWIDKAIYGKLVQSIASYIETMGVTAPQLRFQRGIRTAKFPGEPHSAKGAEFTVEFTDYNNTRNRIVVQAGLDPRGKFIYPRTFKTLSGNEYPLNTRTLKDFTSGKLYTPAVADYTIPPLNYRYSDPTRFREISANTQKMVKKAYDSFNPGGVQPPQFTDENQLQQYITNVLGYNQQTNPIEYDQLSQILRKKIQSPGAPMDNMGQVPNAVNPGNFMTGVGTGKKAFQDVMTDIPVMNDAKREAITEAINQGLSYEEAYDHVLDKTGLPLELTEFDTMGQIDADRQPPIDSEDVARRLIAMTEVQAAANLRVTAEEVQQEYDLSDMTYADAQSWMDEYVSTYNTSLEQGNGTVNARKCALTAATNKVAELRIKLALRDKNTLFPFTDPDPNYSLAQQTHDSEARFDVPYDETDGGITPFDKRNISTMFRKEVDSPSKAVEAEIKGVQKTAFISEEDGKFVVKSESGKPLGTHTTKKDAEKQLQAIEINKHKLDNITPNLESLKHGVKTAESTGIDLTPDEKGQNPMNYSRYKGLVQDYLRAGNIPPTKVDLHKLKDGGYTLDELKSLVDTVKTKDDSAFYPTTHANVNRDQIQKYAEDKIADMYKETPLTPAVPDNPETPSESTIPENTIPENTIPENTIPESTIPDEKLEGGLAEGISESMFDPRELAKGVEVEMEHVRDDRSLAEEIARDHLTEIPDYYTRLSQMETTAKREVVAKDMPALLDRLKAEAVKRVQAEGK